MLNKYKDQNPLWLAFAAVEAGRLGRERLARTFFKSHAICNSPDTLVKRLFFKRWKALSAPKLEELRGNFAKVSVQVGFKKEQYRLLFELNAVPRTAIRKWQICRLELFKKESDLGSVYLIKKLFVWVEGEDYLDRAHLTLIYDGGRPAGGFSGAQELDSRGDLYQLYGVLDIIEEHRDTEREGGVAKIIVVVLRAQEGLRCVVPVQDLVCFGEQKAGEGIRVNHGYLERAQLGGVCPKGGPFRWRRCFS